MPTRRNMCPFSQLLQVTESVLANNQSNVKLNATPCMGSRCQLWVYDGTGSPDDGNCCMVIGAFMSANLAQRAEQVFDAANRLEHKADDAKAQIEEARVRFAELMAAAEKLTAKVADLATK